MNDQDLADHLRSQRTLTQEEVELREHHRDVERGTYAPHGQVAHHTYGESGQQ